MNKANQLTAKEANKISSLYSEKKYFDDSEETHTIEDLFELIKIQSANGKFSTKGTLIRLTQSQFKTFEDLEYNVWRIARFYKCNESKLIGHEINWL